ncbi:DUF3160 domain-containing protein [Prosthecobacter sp.]|uniref:DUF3160 domain-containing protein n=1 Tax=Prosthecobacter sp. TaxID=1965333 RepID=UPI003784DC50
MRRVSFFSILLGAGAVFAAEVPMAEVSLKAFAPTPPALTGPTEPAKPMEAKAPKLSKAANSKLLLEQIGIKLTEAQKTYLEENRFVLIGLEGTNLETVFEAPPKPGQKDEDGNEVRDYRSTPDEMLAAFDKIDKDSSDPWSRNPGQAKLITPDLAMHAFHRYFASAMEFIEKRQMRARLETFLGRGMRSAASLKKGTPAKAAARLEVLEAQLAAAWCVLGLETKAPKKEGEEDIDPEVKKQMERANPSTDPRTVTERLAAMTKRFSDDTAALLRSDVNQIMKAASAGGGGLFNEYDNSKRPDYSQFRVRSHYTKSEELSGYFRSMMYLGRSGYALNPASGPPTLGLSDSLLMLLVLSTPDKDGRRAVDDWRSLMEITGFFAGPSDDLTFIELRKWVKDTLGQDALALSDVFDEKKLGRLKAALGSLRAPLIISDGRGRPQNAEDLRPEFRIFGQRFSYDAWILNNFITDKLTMPSGLFVSAAFGDDVAEEHSQEFIRDRFSAQEGGLEGFNHTLARLRLELVKTPDRTWFGSMAGKQLNALSMLAGHRNANYPAFMNSPAFAAKNIESMLGHWTEIKHDTVLYAKQSYAELGEGGVADKRPLPELPRGFVQPDVAFWREMERLAIFTRAGIKEHQLLPDLEDEEFGTLARFVDNMRFCRQMAEKEIRGEKLTDREHEQIWSFSLMDMDTPVDPSEAPSADRGKVALVTDVHTDAYLHQVLQEALGRPCIMIALVGNENTPRLVAGMAYQHFEFVGSQDKRATDEEWRAKVYTAQPQLPERAKWAVPVFPAKAE